MKKAIIDYTPCQNQYHILWFDNEGKDQKIISETYLGVLKKGKELKEKGIVLNVENKIFPEHSI
jgi:uncharacterized protein YcfL